MTSWCQIGCIKTTKNRIIQEFKYRATAGNIKVIQAAYIGWRNHLKGPIVQISSLAHQFRSVQKLQKNSPNPMTASPPPTTLIGAGFVNIAECPNTRSTQTAIVNNTRLITAPIGPTPNSFCSLLISIKHSFESMLSDFSYWYKMPNLKLTGSRIYRRSGGATRYAVFMSSSCRRLPPTEPWTQAGLPQVWTWKWVYWTQAALFSRNMYGQ